MANICRSTMFQQRGRYPQTISIFSTTRGDPKTSGIVKKYLKWSCKFETLVPFEILSLWLSCSDPSAAPTPGNMSKIFQRKCGEEPPAIVVEPLQLHQNGLPFKSWFILGNKKKTVASSVVGRFGGGHNHHFVFSEKGGVRIFCRLDGFRRFIKATEDFIWDRAYPRGEPAGRVPGALRRRRNNQKYGVSKLKFSTREIISPEIYPQFWHDTSKNFASPVLGQNFKEHCQIISLLGTPNYWTAQGPHMFQAGPVRDWFLQQCWWKFQSLEDMMPCALICEYYNDEISLIVVGMGVKMQGGKRGKDCAFSSKHVLSI